MDTPRGYRCITLVGEEKTIKLYEVSHVNTPEFYDAVINAVSHDKSNGYAIHIEGIRDVPSSLTLREKYAVFASHLGLVSQHDSLNDKISHEKIDLSWGEIPLVDRWRVRLIVKLFSSRLAAIRHMDTGSKNRLRDEILIRQSMPQSPKVTEILFGGTISGKRSHYAADQALEADSSVSLIWGAAHSTDIVQRIQDGGYSLLGEEDIMALSTSPSPLHRNQREQ